MYKVMCQLKVPRLLLLEEPYRFLIPTSCKWVQLDRSMAGHSKWKNIKHTKELKDLEKSKVMAKLIQRLQWAIKEYGSADPKQNKRLEQVIEDAKDQKVPMSTINKQLETATKAKTTGQSEVFAIKGPGKSIFLIDTYYENRNRTKQEISYILKKSEAVWASPQVLHQFECVGRVVCSQYNGKPVKQELLDDSIAHAIEAGAEDVFVEEDEEFGQTFVFKAPPLSIYQVKGALIKLGYTCTETDVQYIPEMYVELNELELSKAENLYARLLGNENVVTVYNNVAE